MTPDLTFVVPEMNFALPPSIWDENSHFRPHFSRDPEFLQHRFTQSVFDAATRGSGTVPALRVRGADLDAAADHYSQLLDEAGERNDYTELLVEDQAFAL